MCLAPLDEVSDNLEVLPSGNTDNGGKTKRTQVADEGDDLWICDQRSLGATFVIRESQPHLMCICDGTVIRTWVVIRRYHILCRSVALPSNGQVGGSHHEHGIHSGLFSMNRTPFCHKLVAFVADKDLRAYKSKKKDIEPSATDAPTRTCSVYFEEVFNEKTSVVYDDKAVISDVSSRVHQGPALASTRIPIAK